MLTYPTRGATVALLTLGLAAIGCGFAPSVDAPSPSGIDFEVPGGDGEACLLPAGVSTFPRVTLFVALDRSAVTIKGGKWDVASSGVRAFVKDAPSRGMRVGLGVFPADSCGLGDLSCDQPSCGALLLAPDAIGVGGAQDKALAEKLTQVKPLPGGWTPETSALALAESWAMDYAKQHPEETTLLAFVTAANVEICAADPGALASIAEDAKESAGVLTYAFGLPGADAPALAAIAKAGGTNQPTMLDAANGSAELLGALQALRGDRLGCWIPAPATGVKEVVYTPTQSPISVDLAEVSGLSACGAGPAYYLDSAALTLCPETCGKARADGTARITVLSACR